MIKNEKPQSQEILHVHAIHPQTAFREEMRKVRRQYGQDHKKLEQERRHREHESRTKELARKAELLEEIVAFKRSKKAIEPQSASTTEDAVSELERKLGRTSIASAGKRAKANGAETDGMDGSEAKANGPRSEWPEFLTARRELRQRNRQTTEQTQSNERLHNLLHIFQSSSSYITPANMDSKIQEALDRPLGDKAHVPVNFPEGEVREEALLGILEGTDVIGPTV